MDNININNILLHALTNDQLREMRKAIDYILDYRPRNNAKFIFIDELFAEHNDLLNFVPEITAGLITAPKLYIIPRGPGDIMYIIHYEFRVNTRNLHVAYMISRNVEGFYEPMINYGLPWFVRSDVNYEIDLYNTPLNSVPIECIVLAIMLQDGFNEAAFMFRETI